MDSDWNTSVKEINGINLDNYFVQQRAYNSVVYVHKKCLKESEPEKETVEKNKVIKEKKNKHKKKQDKCQQLASDSNTFLDNKSFKMPCNNKTILDQTIKFAKNIVPLVIPPDEDKANVFYTIKTSKKYRRADKKPPNFNLEHDELPQGKEERKKFAQTYRKIKKESFSLQESISRSSNNTLDDLNINQSLYCTFSEISEKKNDKKDKHHTKKRNHDSKYTISESFEAVATENIGKDAKIKIHLMNEKDKHFLSDTIKEPVLNAIRNCLLELNNNKTNTDFTIVQKYIKCNSQKLDNILDKLACIEKKLDTQERKLEIYERNLDKQRNISNNQEETLLTYQNRLDSHEVKLETHEVKLDSHVVRLDSHDGKLDSHEGQLNSHEIKLNAHFIKLDSHAVQLMSHEANHDFKQSNQEAKSDSHSKGNKLCAQVKYLEVEGKRIKQSKSDQSNAKSSTLEELGADLIEMDEVYSSEEELHHEMLDRRSKSSIVVDLQKDTKEKRVENLGGGEVPSGAKGGSIGGKLERPNRIPTRFCWTDTVRKT